MEYAFEIITEQHKKEIIDIFNYYIKHSTAAYRDECVSYDFFDNFIEDCIDDSKYVIKNREDVIVGFCMLEYFSRSNTFKHMAEVTYFIKNEFIGFGIGTLALERLEHDAKEKGIKILTAEISSKNIGSINFHKKHGFTIYGELENAGFKFNEYFNLVLMNKKLS